EAMKTLDESVGEVPTSCAFCASTTPDSMFKICGHTYCQVCLAKNASTRLPPIQCPVCDTPVAASNFSDLGSTILQDVMKQSIKLQLKLKPDTLSGALSRCSLCPSSQCSGLRFHADTTNKSAGSTYFACSECSVSGCYLCGVVDNVAHVGRT